MAEKISITFFLFISQHVIVFKKSKISKLIHRDKFIKAKNRNSLIEISLLSFDINSTIEGLFN